jgi:hypothetical protein
MILPFPSLNLPFSPVPGGSLRDWIFLHFYTSLSEYSMGPWKVSILNQISIFLPFPGISGSREKGFYILKLASPAMITHLHPFPPLASWV